MQEFMRLRADNYVTVAQGLPERIPPNQRQNIDALLAHEEARLASQISPEIAKQWLLNYYAFEEDKGVYVLFRDGKWQGFNTRRAMARLILNQQEEFPQSVILVHRMGFPVDFMLVRKLDVPAVEWPEQWISRRAERGDTEGQAALSVED